MPPLTLALPTLCWLVSATKLDGVSLAAAFALLLAFPAMLHLDRAVPSWLRRLTAVAGPVATGSLLMERGPLAGGLASIWLWVTGFHLVYGALRFVTGAATTPARSWVWAELMAAVGPVVAAVALVTSRLWGDFAGYPEPLATLTVPHFHVTFGLLPLTAAALARSGFAAGRPIWGLVALPPLVGLAFATREVATVPGIGEAVLVGWLAVAVAVWVGASGAALRRLPGLAGRVAPLLAAAIAASVSLAPVFSVSLAMGAPRLSIDDMLRWHGAVLAVVTTLLAWVAARHAAFAGIPRDSPTPDLTATARDVAPERALFLDQRTLDLGPYEPAQFERMASALMHYRFYPPWVMAARSTFGEEGREARVGDRIGMSLLVPLVPGFPAARFPATTVLHLASRTPDRVAFGYTTTTAHYGAGAWEARLEHAGGRMQLTLSSRMRPTHLLALAGLPVYRWFQKRAHRAGMANLAAAAVASSASAHGASSASPPG